MSIQSTHVYDNHKRQVRQRIIKTRKAKNLGLNETAKAAGIAPSYLCDIEKGRRDNPSIETILRLAHAIGVTPEYLMFGI